MNEETYRWRTWSNHKVFRPQHDLETPMGVSVTIPNQTKPLRELLERFAKGLPIPQNAEKPYYDSDTENMEPLPDLRKMDLSEIAAVRDYNAAEIARIRKEQAEQQQARAAEEHAAWMKSEFRKWKEAEDKAISSPIKSGL